MDIFLLLFLLIVGIGIVVTYIYYFRERDTHLKAINTGICPKCKKKSIYISDTRGGGCGPKLVTFKCRECGYEDNFTIEGSCGI